MQRGKSKQIAHPILISLAAICKLNEPLFAYA